MKKPTEIRSCIPHSPSFLKKYYPKAAGNKIKKFHVWQKMGRKIEKLTDKSQNYKKDSKNSKSNKYKSKFTKKKRERPMATDGKNLRQISQN